jgi:hypothetical protein
MRRLIVIVGLLAGMLVVLFSSVPAVERELDEANIKECSSPATTLRVLPAQEITAGKDICEVIHTGPAAWCIDDWIQAGDSYASYQDPVEAGCIDPYPFQVIEIHFMLCASMPVVTEIYVDLMEANLDDPTCPFPGQGIFTSEIFVLEIPGPGDYTVMVPVLEKVCVDGPFFAGFNFPELVDGLGPITDDTPDGCWDYIWFDVDPWDLVSEVGFPGNIILYSVGLTAAQNTCGDYPPPEPVMVEPNDTAWYDQTYFSDSVRVTVEDVSDGSKIAYATFEYMDPSGIWYPIGTDYDGTDIWYDSWDTAQVGGDGWSYVWVADGLAEDYYLIRATMIDSLGRPSSDTVTIYYDPLPPIPTIVQPESTGLYCSPIEVIFSVEADHIAEMEGTIYNFSEGWYTALKGAADSTYNKGIPSMKQGDLYPDGKNRKGQRVNMGCAPTAGAACLKWWAGQSPSYGPLTAGLTDKQLVRGLAGSRYMKTSPNTGTKASRVKYGLDRWIWDKLGLCWFENVRKVKPKNWKKFFELYASELKKEDILIGWSGKPWHVTTGNSATAKSMTYDVMNPTTGNTETYKWPKGAGSSSIFTMWILSPKIQPQPPPATPTPPPTQYEQLENHYRIVWTPDTTQTPYDMWYGFHVRVTDSLGHVGEDLFFFELADYVCGDANGDGVTSVGDIVYNVNYLYKGGASPEPMEAGDASYLYKDGPLPGCF